MQQAKDYAGMLGLKFACATNGREIIEFDYFTGEETHLTAYPTPAELWTRYRAGNGLTDDAAAARLLTPMNLHPRQGRALLPGDRREPGSCGHPYRTPTPTAHHGDGHGKDGRGLSDLLEAVEMPVGRSRTVW